MHVNSHLYHETDSASHDGTLIAIHNQLIQHTTCVDVVESLAQDAFRHSVPKSKAQPPKMILNHLSKAFLCKQKSVTFTFNLTSQKQGKSRENIPRRRRHIIPRILINLRNLALQIHLFRLPPLRLLEQLPPKEQNREQPNHEVAEQESRHVPLSGQEDWVSAHEGHDHGADHAHVCCARLHDGFVGKGVAVYVLGAESTAPAEEGGAGDAVVDELGGGDEVDEPGEDGRGAVGDLEEG